MTEKERKPNYNPADYAKIEEQAKEMSRKDLEDDWVLTKDKKYTHPCVTLGVIIGWIFIIALVIIGISVITSSLVRDLAEIKLVKKTRALQEEICPVLGNFKFVIQEKEGLKWDEVKIVCVEPIE